VRSRLARHCSLSARVVAVADAAEGGEGAFASVGEGAGVLLGGSDSSVAEAFLDDDDVGATGE
jgi:hypothetical protein